MPRSAVGRVRIAWATAALLGVAAVLAAALAGPAALRRGEVSPFTNPADFRAFYCAGKTFVARHDPYRVEPLRACERAAVAEMGLVTYAALVTPAPLPPYALVLFGCLAGVAFPAAVCGWFGLLCVATFATIVALRRMTNFSAAAIALLCTACAIDAVMLGQLVPLIVFLIVCCAAALRAGYVWPCAAAAALAAIEPHLALPVCLSLFAFKRDLRLPLAALGGAVLCAPAAVGGMRLYWEYFSRELPLHALSETHALQVQTSLTTALAVFAHLDDHRAVVAGEIDYAAMLGLGLAVAALAARRLQDERFLVFVPPAFVAFGGVFAHIYGLYVVVPAAMLLAARAGGRTAIVCWCALAGIALSTILDAFTGGFARSGDPGLAAALEAAGGAERFASEVSRVWQTARMPADAAGILATTLVKLPGLIGALAFVVTATVLALRRPSATPR